MTDPMSDASSIAKIIDPHFDRPLQTGNAPGIAYATLVNGDIVYSRGIGTVSVDEDRAPDEHTAFRIASMTKSFTAATVLSLRDAGLIDLDAAVVQWVPELAQGGPDGSVITVRHLLTMGAGFATDDPWGDRQQDLDISAFRALLATGVRPVLRPGDRFEYSNMGYAILGLVITAVTGLPYTEVVRERVLVPLGMQETTFAADDLVASSVATGYAKRSTGWQVEPLAASGAFSPMGGVISTLNDLVAVGQLPERLRNRWWSDLRAQSPRDAAHAETGGGDRTGHGRRTYPASNRHWLRLWALRGVPPVGSKCLPLRRVPRIWLPHAVAPGVRIGADRLG